MPAESLSLDEDGQGSFISQIARKRAVDDACNAVRQRESSFFCFDLLSHHTQALRWFRNNSEYYKYFLIAIPLGTVDPTRVLMDFLKLHSTYYSVC